MSDYLDVAPMRESTPGEAWSTPGQAPVAGSQDDWWKKILQFNSMFGGGNLGYPKASQGAPQSGGGFAGGFAQGLSGDIQALMSAGKMTGGM